MSYTYTLAQHYTLTLTSSTRAFENEMNRHDFLLIIIHRYCSL